MRNNTKANILRVALKLFMEKVYSNTSVSMIGKELGITKGNIVFHYKAKEEMLAELVNNLCEFQWRLMEREVADGKSSLLAYLLEIATMVSMAEENEVEKDIYVSAYTNPASLEIIRKNDTKKAQMVFKDFCPGWTEQEFINTENIVSGIEYSMFMTGNTQQITLDERICRGLDAIMMLYGLPKELRQAKLQKVLDMDYRNLGKRILKEFYEYVTEECR